MQPARSAPPDTTPSLAVRLNAGVLLKVLVAVFAVLLALHLVVVSSYLDDWRFPARDRFFFDQENNLPTFFSTLILLLAAGLIAMVAAAKRRQADAYVWHWRCMALVFLLLAGDEAASLHEVLINPLRSQFQLTGFLWFGWVIAGAVFVAGFALAYLRFLGHLPVRFRWLFVLAGGLYVVGALGLEMVGGHVFLAGQPQQDIGPYMLVMTLEESLEMAGILLFDYSLLAYLESCCPQVMLQLAGGGLPFAGGIDPGPAELAGQPRGDVRA